MVSEEHRQIPAGMSAIFPITVTNANGQTKVNHYAVAVSMKNKDEVVWQGSGDFIETFPPGSSPFDRDFF